MIFYPPSSIRLSQELEKYNPVMVIFGGKHEPNEPTLRLLYTELSGGRILHRQLENYGALCLGHPVGNRPVGFYNRLAAYLIRLAGELAWGERKLEEELNRQGHQKVGEALEEYFTGLGRLELPPRFPANYFFLHEAAKKLTDNIFSRKVNGQRIADIVRNVLEKYPVPLSDYAIAARLCRSFPETIFVFLHGDYNIPNHQVRASDRLLEICRGQDFFQLTPLYSDQPKEDQDFLTRSELINKQQARSLWVEYSYAQLGTADLPARNAKLAAVLYQSFCRSPKHQEEKAEEEQRKQSGQLATRYLFEGSMRYSDFRAVRDSHSELLLKLVEHIYHEQSLLQKPRRLELRST